MNIEVGIKRKASVLLPVALVFLLSFSDWVYAQNKVVVIPMFTESEPGVTSGSNLSNLITVSKSGGDYDSISEALDSISDAGPKNPYLVYVGPGEYAIDSALRLPGHVSLVGAGIGSTIVEGKDLNNSGAACGRSLVLVEGDFSAIRNISLRNSSGTTGTSPYGGICSDQPINSITLDSVDLLVSAPGFNVIGVESAAATLYIVDSKIVITGNTAKGLFSYISSGLKMWNSEVRVTGTAQESTIVVDSQNDSDLEIRDSEVVTNGTLFKIDAFGVSSQFNRKVFGSYLVGEVLLAGQVSTSTPNPNLKWVEVFNSVLELATPDAFSKICINTSSTRVELGSDCVVPSPD